LLCSEGLVPTVTERQPDGDGWHQPTDAENHAFPAAAGQEKRTASYAKEQAVYRARKRC
jgi:hypothetical protein